ncbi:MAG: MFS transporter [Lachnospiraceae bacterium]|nr:MFS transporter [Lachnospiraceae bacterium]
MRDGENLTGRYALIMGLYWANYAVISSFASMYLLDRGFSNTSIGIMMAVAALFASIFQPVIGAYADKPQSPSVKIILMVVIGAFMISSVCIIVTSSRLPMAMVVFYAVSLMLLQSMNPLCNSLGIMSEQNGKRVNFGVARGTGSITFAVLSIVAGKAVAVYGSGPVPWAAIAIYVLMGIALLAFPFKKPTVTAGITKRGSFIKRYPSFLIVIVAAVFIYAGHCLLNNFIYQITVQKGGDSSSMGIALAIAAFLEIPTMFLFSKMLRIFDSGKWIVISGIAFTIKAVAALLAPNVMGFYLAQLFQVFAYPVLTVASVYFISDIVELEDTAKGQALFTMAVTIGNVVASAIGGRIIDQMGVNVMMEVTVALSAVGAVVMWIGVKSSRRRA